MPQCNSEIYFVPGNEVELANGVLSKVSDGANREQREKTYAEMPRAYQLNAQTKPSFMDSVSCAIARNKKKTHLPSHAKISIIQRWDVQDMCQDTQCGIATLAQKRCA